MDLSLRKKCPYSELFWSEFSCIQTEYGEIRRISPYSVQIKENADQNNSECGHFSRTVLNGWSLTYPHQKCSALTPQTAKNRIKIKRDVFRTLSKLYYWNFYKNRRKAIFEKIRHYSYMIGPTRLPCMNNCHCVKYRNFS